MEFSVLGAGMMGRAAVHDLARAPGVTAVRVFDVDAARAQEVAEEHGAGKARGAGLDASDPAALEGAIAGCDAALGAISYRFNAQLTRCCIAQGVHFCDLGGNNTVVQQQLAMSPEAREAGVAIVPDCGLAPGLVSILTARCLELMPDAQDVKLRVGGLPRHPRGPFGYQIVFSVEPSYALRGGEIVEVPTLGELERLAFPPPFEQLEAFNTSGGASTLPWTMKGRLRNLDYKTIRYPGHRDLVAALFALGLADERPRDIGGVQVRPRTLLEAMMNETLASDAADCILCLVEASGPSGRVGFRLVDHHDERTGLSAMMRCTAFPAAVVAHMLAAGLIEERGTLTQELSVPAEAFVAALIARGLPLEPFRTPAD
jgi:lysine 6-dehydrogenase